MGPPCLHCSTSDRTHQSLVIPTRAQCIGMLLRRSTSINRYSTAIDRRAEEKRSQQSAITRLMSYQRFCASGRQPSPASPAPRQLIAIAVLVNAGVDSSPQCTTGRDLGLGIGPHSDAVHGVVPAAIHHAVLGRPTYSRFFGLRSFRLHMRPNIVDCC